MKKNHEKYMDEFNLIKELLLRDRSIRRFRQESVSIDALRELVGLTRYCASGANRQPLVYALANEQCLLDKIFPLLRWAGYYEDWTGPDVGERPVAYILQALDTGIASNQLCDDGIQLQAITLGAAALGIGACIIKSFDAAAVSGILGLPENIRPLYVVALGYPSEDTIIVPQRDRSEIRYYRDDKDRQCVPKRPLEDVIININNNRGAV